MDIRKFFGPQTATKKGQAPPKTGKDANKQPSNKSLKESGKNNKQSQSSSSPSKKRNSSPQKKPVFENEDAVIIDADEEPDEEVVKTSQSSSNKGSKSKKTVEKKPVQKNKKVNGSDSSQDKHSGKSKSQASDKGNEKERKSKKKTSVIDDEDEVDFIEIESVKSSDSGEGKLSSSKSSKLDKSTDKKKKGEKEESVKEQKRQNSSKKEKKGETPTRSSPRKNPVVQEENKQEKSRKRKKISSDDEEEDSMKIVKESDVEDEEEVITSRRKRHSKGSSSKQSKKAAKVLESDSDEDPLPKDKPQTKRKKKEAKSFVDDSDEEKKVTALDKYVIHNAQPSSEDSKKKAEKKDSSTKETPVNVMDFFGSGTTTRSDRTTAVAKRKHEDSEKKEEVDLTFDEEMHDDEDFLKTLDQLDGPEVKKVKQSEKQEDVVESSQGSLASKLAGKMKQASQGGSTNGKQGDEDTDKNRNVVTSPAKKKNVSPASKKGKVYTMEVTRTKPPTVVVSPGKSKDKDDATPQKKGATTPAKAASTEKKAAADKNDDDGFGPKAISGFRAFKTRGGPMALGSKEIPEGAENCLEGLTFVITGILDSIERDDAKTLVEKHGGKVTGSISGKTSYVVVGRDAGESKLNKARSLKVKQVDEDGLFDLISTLPGKVSKYELQAKEQLKKEASEKASQKAAKEKEEVAAKKLESFRSEKDARNQQSSTPSPSKKRSLFTQIKDSAESSSAGSVPSPSSSKLLDQSQSPSQRPKKASTTGQSETLLWVDKHKPTSLKQIIGQQGDKSNAKKLLHWLKSWHENIIVKGLKAAGNFFGKGDGTGSRAALLSGPPGIGKTTTATLVCKELGFSYVELNASDTRSKRSLKEVVSESLNNQTLVDYMGSHSGTPSGQSHCLIMDEVDGMAGNEDRGGLQELVQLIKTTKIPVICICNDRNSMKMRTLSNYCFDLRFQRPRVEQIKGAMMSLAYKEGLKIPPAALNEIILASNHDVRQVIHNLSMWSASDKNLTFEQVKADAQKAQKNIKLGPFDVCRKVFVNDDETRKMSILDKSDLFFHDYSFGPLFVHENYPNIIPANAKGNQSRHMSCLARTIDSLCDGDLVDKLIRKEGNWNLLPTQAMYSSVIPGEIMRGTFPQMPDFPQWLGKFSTTNKTHRILQELGTHMRLEISCDKRGLNLDYLPALRARLTRPLTSQGSEGVPEVIKIMDEYDIVKEDFDNILEVTKYPNSFDPMSKLDPKTKAAFTRTYNKEIHMIPYATGTLSKKRKARGAPMDESDFATEEGEGGMKEESEDEEEEGIEADTMIKSKKPSSNKGKGSSQAAGGKGKGKGKGGGKGGKGKR